MTDSSNAQNIKYCQRCGQTMDLKAKKCNACNAPVPKAEGSGGGGNKTGMIVLIVVVCAVVGFITFVGVGIIAAVSLPSFIGAQDKARQAAVKGNMRTVQIAAEAYATDKGGNYPTSIDDKLFRTYFPGGDSGGTQEGHPPVNPYTAKAEWPVEGHVTDVTTARTAESDDSIGEGAVEYSCIEGTSYAIRGGGKDGKLIEGKDAGTIMVLSNQ